ncbi:hypothetical protein ACWD0Z_15405 [Streptomyces sp. NPDC003007]
MLEGLRREGGSAALRAAVAARGQALTARTRTMIEGAGAGALHAYLDRCTAAGTATGQTADGPGPSAR